VITLEELNPHNYPTTPEMDENLLTMLEKMNIVRKAYDTPMVVTSGLRSTQDQMRINPKAPHSKHLIGAAVDIADPDGKFKRWIKNNPSILSRCDLYLEYFQSTPTWVHLQCIAPVSGNRFFFP
jgi:hypothetical protein